jgi:hypothetical protein
MMNAEFRVARNRAPDYLSQQGAVSREQFRGAGVRWSNRRSAPCGRFPHSVGEMSRSDKRGRGG